MSDTVTTAELTHLDDPFKDADEVETGGGRPPDGDYIFRIEAVELRKGRESGDPYFNWELHVHTGEYAGRKVYRVNGMKSDQNIGYLKHDLKTCGIPVDNPKFKISWFLTGSAGEGKALPKGFPTLNDLLDKLVKGTIKTRKDDPAKYNLYLNELVDPSTVEVGAVNPAGNGDDGEAWDESEGAGAAFNPFADA